MARESRNLDCGCEKQLVFSHSGKLSAGSARVAVIEGVLLTV
jgi:hypothetical protein